ncbi:MAG: hypothetical protein Q7T03_09705 [Deltaproteobacteria bacterium]|nr:hypothetical protein [Deltaproteobacteria bacterium]
MGIIFSVISGNMGIGVGVAALTAEVTSVAANDTLFAASVPAGEGLLLKPSARFLGMNRFVPHPQTAGHIPRVSDKKLAQVLKKYKGNQSAAGRDPRIQMSPAAVNVRIHRAEAGSSLYPFQILKGFPPGARPDLDEVTLAKALKINAGSRRATANDPEIGLSKTAIAFRIAQSEPGSPLYPYRKIKGKKGATPLLDDAILAVALKNHEGSRVETGSDPEIAMSAAGVSNRICRADKNSPLHRFKTIKGKGGVAPRVDDATLASLLRQHRASRTEAGKAATSFSSSGEGLTVSAVTHRIERAKSNSPLAKFKR